MIYILISMTFATGNDWSKTIVTYSDIPKPELAKLESEFEKQSNYFDSLSNDQKEDHLKSLEIQQKSVLAQSNKIHDSLLQESRAYKLIY